MMAAPSHLQSYLCFSRSILISYTLCRSCELCMTLQHSTNAENMLWKTLTFSSSLVEADRCPFSVQCDISLMKQKVFYIISCIYFFMVYFKKYPLFFYTVRQLKLTIMVTSSQNIVGAILRNLKVVIAKIFSRTQSS